MSGWATCTGLLHREHLLVLEIWNKFAQWPELWYWLSSCTMMIEATAHTAQTSKQALRVMFPGRLTSHFAVITWPNHFTHLTWPKYFLWGYVKSKVQKMFPVNTDGLKTANLEVYSWDTKRNAVTCYSTLSNITAECNEQHSGHLQMSYSNMND